MPDAPASCDVYWITVGIGESVESRFGHTILRVVDKSSREEYNFNWGVFDFADPLLPLNFFRAKLRYWVSNERLSTIIRFYRNYEHRPVVMQKVNLTLAQKKELFSILHENLKPEHVYFWYHHFFNNCGTIPLHYLDLALAGKIREAYGQKFSGVTFRQYINKYLAEPFAIAFFLDILMNSEVDFPISQWQEMFFPPKIQEYLSLLPSYDDSFVASKTEKLFGEPEQLVIAPAVDLTQGQNTGVLFLAGFLSILAVLTLAVKLGAKRAAAGITALLAAWMFFSGVLGSVMTLSWAFSYHLDTHHNVNLLLFWPVDFWGCYLLIKKKGRFASAFWLLHLLGIAIHVGFNIFGLWAQNVSGVTYYLLPVHLLAVLFSAARIAKAQPKH